MALSQAIIDAIPDYAWSDIAKMAKMAMLNLTINEETTMMGHHVRKADMDSLKTLYELATAQDDAETADESGGDIALVRYGERV